MGTIAENLLELNNEKTLLKTALENKGQDMTNVPFTQYHEKVNAIETGGGENKLAQVVDRSITSLTAEDLKGATRIGAYVFYYCTELKNVEIPNNIMSIMQNAFRGTNITSIIIPDSVTSIGTEAFRDCKNLTNVNIPHSITYISSSLFLGCSNLKNIVIPNNITDIQRTAFALTGLTSIIIPNNVKDIGSDVFRDCKNLTQVIYEGQAPEILNTQFIRDTAITKYDFRNCTKVPTLANTDALGHASGCQIIIPDALYDEWTQATNWVALTNVVFVKASEYVEA